MYMYILCLSLFDSHLSLDPETSSPASSPPQVSTPPPPVKGSCAGEGGVGRKMRKRKRVRRLVPKLYTNEEGELGDLSLSLSLKY